MNDHFVISAVPIVKDVNPAIFYILNPDLTANQNLGFIVKGKMFLQLRNVYLSAADQTMFNGVTFYNLFSAVNNLSATYMPFSAYLLPNFSYTENFIKFDIPYPQSGGYFDIIVENEAGYGKLTQHATTLTPSLSNGVYVKQYIHPTPTPTISLTPSNSPTPSVTPTHTPSNTPSATFNTTPTVTPTTSIKVAVPLP
jgi:hypothetical protein